MEITESILDSYGRENDILYLSYNMMCMMLDTKRIKSRLQLLRSSEIYIYGAGYLGIQFVRAIKEYVSIAGVIDKRGETIVPTDIQVVSMETFLHSYHGQKVVIASLEDCREIKAMLSTHVNDSDILYLNEFLGGIL